MKYKEVKINNLLISENYVIYNYRADETENHIYLKSKNKICKCPKCNNQCILHSTYDRTIQDIPLHNKTTWLHVKAYEYECKNSNCEITTFNEELEFAKKYQVMTDALLQLILCVSIFLSNSSASLILSFMGVKVGADTIKNIYDRIKIMDNKDVEEIGIDDVATRKGMKYATAIYDLKNHHMIALLEGRDANSVKDWLKEHPKIKKVARDRASSYATAISEILPNCMQIADRFHLLDNLIGYLKDIFKDKIPSKIFIKDNKILEEEPKKVYRYKSNITNSDLKSWSYDNTSPIDESGNIIIYDDKKHDLDSPQYLKQAQNRIEKYNKVIKLRNEYKVNKNMIQLSLKFGFCKTTIKKYVLLTDDEVEKIKERKNYKKRKTKVDNYKNIIYKMLVDNRNLDEIISFIIFKGYNDNINDLAKYVYLIAKNNFSNLNFSNYNRRAMTLETPKDVIIINRQDLLREILIINPNIKRNKDINNNLKIIEEKYPVVKEVRNIFHKFHSIIMGNDVYKIDKFIDEYKNSNIKSLCNGLKKDIAAVKNAISSPISSGFVEGNNNKFKLIKRIVYGKMKLVNLFKKCYVAFLATKDDFSIYDLI